MAEQHPLFARYYARMSVRAEPLLAEYRRRLLAGLGGEVVEVGAGNGLNFGHYPRSVRRVTAVEPERRLRASAGVAAGRIALPEIRVVDGTAERLPLPDDSADAVVFSLVLCSVADMDAAVREARRILRPGGRLRLWEHVQAPPGTPMERFQRIADACGWPRLAGNCHTHRDPLPALRAAGFTLRPGDLTRFRLPPTRLAPPTAPMLLARADY
ncbi:class I SAM-dependent methyltransferase [Phaeacidiphilus oryzae]|uniref:class I SAM-dependent methyltransferase n=1 Tax=Phaeacidiphilus oryzae TaxID=348818 RepID=UPI00056B9DC5|nr:class I SAM-dependent methyltransferase [Phaeacidiphilus oryzae]